MEYPGGGGSNCKQPSVGGMDIFWHYTLFQAQDCLKIRCLKLGIFVAMSQMRHHQITVHESPAAKVRLSQT